MISQQITRLFRTALTGSSSVLTTGVLSTFFFFACAPSQGQGVVLEGEITAQDHTINYELRMPFRAWLNDDSWQLQVRYGTNYEETCGYDKEKICLAHKDFRTGQFGPAVIQEGSYPFFAEPTTRLVWLAFASSDYLATNRSSLSALWQAGFLEPISHAIAIDGLQFFEDGRLPAKIDFTEKGRLLENQTNLVYLSRTISPGRIREELKRYKAFDGKVWAEYRVKATTNYEGMVLPKEFEFKVFSYKNGRKADHQTYSGLLRGISQSRVTMTLPPLDSSVWVTDYRFSDDRRYIDAIHYEVTNGVWPSANEPRLQELFKRQQANQPPVLIRGPIQLKLTTIFLVIILITLPFLVRRWSKKPKHT